jgi:hypothetical protein
MGMEMYLTNKLNAKAIFGLVQLARYTSALIELRYDTSGPIISSSFSSDRTRPMTMHITSMVLIFRFMQILAFFLFEFSVSPLLVVWRVVFRRIIASHFPFIFSISISLVLSCLLDKDFIHFKEWFITYGMRVMVFHQKLFILFSHKKT